MCDWCFWNEQSKEVDIGGVIAGRHLSRIHDFDYSLNSFDNHVLFISNTSA